MTNMSTQTVRGLPCVVKLCQKSATTACALSDCCLNCKNEAKWLLHLSFLHFSYKIQNSAWLVGSACTFWSRTTQFFKNCDLNTLSAWGPTVKWLR